MKNLYKWDYKNKTYEKVSSTPGIDSIQEPIKIEYKNWKGNTTVRTINPIQIWFGSTEYHRVHQWFLKAYDCDKCSERDFALKDIVKFL